jgi:hypothetical protein
MRCTVDGLTPNRPAMTRMPGLPGVARASRISFFQRRGYRSRSRKAGADSFRNHRPLEFGKHAQHLKHRKRRSAPTLPHAS